MATITSGGSLSRTEVQIDADIREVTLTVAGGLSNDGVTLQALYSYLKKVWRVQNFTIGATSGTTGSPTQLVLDSAAGSGSEEILQGMAVTTSGGTGTLAADAEVVSVSGTTVTLTANAITNNFDGTETITFQNHLIEYPFPLVAITPEQFEWSFDWTPDNTLSTTRNLIRTAGWREITTAGVVQKEYVGVISLGNIDGTQTGGGDTVYYAFRTSGNTAYDTKADFDFAGPVNQAIQTFENGGADNRSKELALFIREEGKTFDKSDTPAIGIASGNTINYQVYRFPLSESTDLNYTVTDAVIEAADGADQKYGAGTGGNAGLGPKINYLATDVSSATIFSGATDLVTSRNFGVRIDASAGSGGSLSLVELYSWSKYKLRQNVNIDDDTDAVEDQIGSTSDELLQFVGPQLQSRLVTNGDGATTPSGVSIENFASGDIGNIALAYTGGGGSLEEFPKVASGTISFNANLVGDASPSFTMYYEYTRQYDVDDMQLQNVSQSAGNPGTADLTSATNDLPTVTVGDYIDISGFSTTPGNNGIWEVTGVTTQTSNIQVTRLDDVAVANEGPQSGGTENFRFNPVDSPDALIVVDTSNSPIRGQGTDITGTTGNGRGATGEYDFDYAFTNDTSPDSANTGENRASLSNVNIVIRAVGTDKAQWVSTPGTIIDSNANNISVVAPLERNYSA